MQGYILKPKKAQEQDGFGKKMKYHFHITNLHKYTQLEYLNIQLYVKKKQKPYNVVMTQYKLNSTVKLDNHTLFFWSRIARPSLL